MRTKALRAVLLTAAFLGIAATCLIPTAHAHVDSTNGTTTISGTVSYFANGNPTTLGTWYYGQQAVAGDTIGAYKLPAHAYTVNQTLIQVQGTLGSGTGNTVIRVSDGTNNCDATCACSSCSNTIGSKRPTMSGTCAFAANAALTVTINSTNCSTANPGIWNVAVEGIWQ